MNEDADNKYQARMDLKPDPSQKSSVWMVYLRGGGRNINMRENVEKGGLDCFGFEIGV